MYTNYNNEVIVIVIRIKYQVIVILLYSKQVM